MGISGSLEKMKIKAYSDPDFAKKVGEYTVMINPEKYSHGFRICYTNPQGPGSPGGTPQFNKIPSDTVSFELVFDGTGVVPSPLPGFIPWTEDGVASQIEAFKRLVFNYNGNVHSPNLLKLIWGKLLFKGRLTKLDLTYTLFKPDGTPLRARANATFKGFNDEEELQLKAQKSSPDLSHVLTVKAGDTLPLMCNDVYGRSDYYVQVARVNGLADFRRIKIGTQLLFPPLGEAPQ